MKLRTILMVGLAALTLAACSSKPASDLYVLRVPDDAATTCNKPYTLAMNRPSAPNEYDTKRIAVMLDHNHLTYYTGASWASPFPDQLQDFLSDAFTRQGLTVLDGSDDTDTASKLHITIREADITNAETPIVQLRLTGTVSNASGHTTHFKVNAKVPAEKNHMPQIVDAYDAAAMQAAVTIMKSMKLRCAGNRGTPLSRHRSVLQ